MKSILKALGLPADATEEQAKAAITELQKNAKALDAANETIAEMKRKLDAAPSGGSKESPEFTALVAAKIQAGLPRAQAEEVARNQIAHDAAEKKAAKK